MKFLTELRRNGLSTPGPIIEAEHWEDAQWQAVARDLWVTGEHEDTSFFAGDVVHLKSGSPELIVENVTDQGVHVAWLDDQGGPQRYTFREE